MASEEAIYTVGELIKAGVLYKPLDGNHGGIHPKGNDFVESGIPFVMASDMSNGQVDTKTCKFISADQASTLRKGFAITGDVLISHKATIGRTAIVGEIESEFIVLTPQVTYYRVKDTNQLNNRYLKYYFDSYEFQGLLNQWAGGGSTRAYLGITGQLKLPIKILDIQKQKAIAHILGSLDDKIELNRQMNETLESMAQALFKSWFVDFDPVIDNALAAGNTIPDEFIERAEQRKGIEKKDNAEIQDLFPDEFEFTEDMGWIPNGWRTSTLDDLTTELRRGISPKYTEVDGVRVVNQRCIRNHSIDYSVCRLNDANVRKVEGRYLEVGDVLVNSTGVGTLGRMAQVFYLDEPAVVDSHVTVVRPNAELVKPYMFGRLMLSIESLIESMGLGSTGQTELSRVHLGELVVCIPPIELQEFVEKLFLSYSDKSAFNIQQNITLSKLRDTLLPKLMSGELRITDDML